MPPIVAGNTVTLAATSLAGESNGDGALATLTFEVVAVKTSTLTLSEVLLTDSAGRSSRPQVEPTQITESALPSATIHILSGSVSSPAVGDLLILPLTIKPEKTSLAIRQPFLMTLLPFATCQVRTETISLKARSLCHRLLRGIP